MSANRISDAVQRIEDGLSRIETALAADPGKEPGTNPDALRRAVTAALADLDRLIARIEP